MIAAAFPEHAFFQSASITFFQSFFQALSKLYLPSAPFFVFL